MTKSKNVQSIIALVPSFKSAPQGTKVRELAGNKMLKFTLQMPCSITPEQATALQTQVTSGARGPLNDAELTDLFGEKPSHLSRTCAAAREHGLTVLPRSAADVMFGHQRVQGTYAATKKFFPGLKLSHYVDKKGGKFIGREGNITIKQTVPVVGVYGLDTRDIADGKYPLGRRVPKPSSIPSGLTSRGLAKLQGFDMAALDQVADVVTGYISLGGDNGKRMQADAAFAAKAEGIKLANIIGVSVDGTPIDGGASGYADGATVENALDLQAHVLMNPNGHCVVFRADNSDDAFASAAEAAVAYTGVKLPGGKVLRLRACTISWGMAETNFTAQSLGRWEKMAAAARLKGLIITAATGDNGSKDSTAKPVTDAPSCVPNIIGAAGIGVRSTDGKTVSDRYVWGDTGGGISEVFAPMPEEAGLGLPVSADNGKPGHCNSLIADDAAPESGPFVRYQVRSSQVGGTSHAAPIIGIKLSKMNKKLEDGGAVINDQIAFIYGHLKDGILEMVTEDGTNGDYNAKTTDVINVCVGGGSLSYAGYLKVGAANKAV